MSGGGSNYAYAKAKDDGIAFYPLLHPVRPPPPSLTSAAPRSPAAQDGEPWYELRWIGVVALICCCFGLALSVISCICGVLGLFGIGADTQHDHDTSALSAD